MQSRMDDFREFVSRYPKLRDDVRGGKRTWQNIYEEWYLYGEQDSQWSKYRDSQEAPKPTNQNTNPSLNDSIKTIFSYIQKVNPDSLNRSLNSIQKVVQIAQTFGTKRVTPNLLNSSYNDWWD